MCLGVYFLYVVIAMEDLLRCLLVFSEQVIGCTFLTTFLLIHMLHYEMWITTYFNAEAMVDKMITEGLFMFEVYCPNRIQLTTKGEERLKQILQQYSQ